MCCEYLVPVEDILLSGFLCVLLVNVYKTFKKLPFNFVECWFTKLLKGYIWTLLNAGFYNLSWI